MIDSVTLTAKIPIGIAGTGRVAQALGRLLAQHGEPVAAMAGRDPERTRTAAAFAGAAVSPVEFEELPARAGRILIAVSDGAVPEVARRLAQAGMRTGTALHTCGAHGPELLAPLRAAGVACAVLHPLQTLANPEQGAHALLGAAFAVAGDRDAVQWARAIVALAGGRLLSVREGCMPLYHAAAVMASNHITGLVDAAVILMKAAGIEPETALGALAPLMRAAIENALASGPRNALTGPIERGDAETVRNHLACLAGVPDSARDLYRAASRHVLDLARRRGLAAEKATAIELLLREE